MLRSPLLPLRLLPRGSNRHAWCWKRALARTILFNCVLFTAKRASSKMQSTSRARSLRSSIPSTVVWLTASFGIDGSASSRRPSSR
eukprot:3952866-Pleurochrysis_carterae.AAC.1